MWKMAAVVMVGALMACAGSMVRAGTMEEAPLPQGQVGEEQGIRRVTRMDDSAPRYYERPWATGKPCIGSTDPSSSSQIGEKTARKPIYYYYYL